MLSVHFWTSLEQPCEEMKEETVTVQISDFPRPWLICHGVKHSVTPVHGDKLLAT